MLVRHKMNKKKTNIWTKLLAVAFIIFIGLYIAGKSGYYASEVNQKVLLTDEAIDRFEEDVINGKVVDVNSYLLEDKKNYENDFTKAGDTFTEAVQSFMTDGLQGFWNFLKSLFV